MFIIHKHDTHLYVGDICLFVCQFMYDKLEIYTILLSFHCVKWSLLNSLAQYEVPFAQIKQVPRGALAVCNFFVKRESSNSNETTRHRAMDDIASVLTSPRQITLKYEGIFN